MGINLSYPKIRPNLWAAMDNPMAKNKNGTWVFPPVLWYEPFPKIVRAGYHDLKLPDGRMLRDCPQIFFEDDKDGAIADAFTRRSHEVQFLRQSTTFVLAMHMLVWLGARRIHLVGCDFGGEYWHGRKEPPEQQKMLERTYVQTAQSIAVWHAQARMHGVEIVSCTPGSRANEYIPYVPLVQAVKDSRARWLPAWARPAEPADCRAWI
jgi:hypothetical protein